MKFKTLFQRRSTASMTESEQMSGGSSTKRKKKDAKALVMAMKSASGTKSSALLTVSRQENCASCSAAATAEEAQANNVNAGAHHCQPQPDEFAESIRYSCENCGVLGNQRRVSVDEVLKMKILTDADAPQSGEENDNMGEEELKKELAETKSHLVKAKAKIIELTERLEKNEKEREAKEQKDKLLTRDFLYCMRAAERFRFEEEGKVIDMREEVAKLKLEIANLRKGNAAAGSDDVGVTLGKQQANCSQFAPVAAAGAGAVEPQMSNDLHANIEDVEEKALSTAGLASYDDAIKSRRKTEAVLDPNSKQQMEREAKLSDLRKSFRGSLRNGLLNWCQQKTRNYTNIEITNFSTSWKNGLALAAVVHSLNPAAFDYKELSPIRAVDNFEKALEAAKKLGVTKDLDVLSIIVTTEPAWEPIVAYVTEIFVSAPN